MLRAAAKNYKYTVAVGDPTDYSEISLDGMSESQSRKLASNIFNKTNLYDSDVASWLKDTKEINLDDRTMIPGFIEGHAHIMGTGYNQKNLDLLNTSSYDEIIQIVKEKSQTKNRRCCRLLLYRILPYYEL